MGFIERVLLSCVYVSVCSYSFIVKASSDYSDVWDMIEGTDERSCIVGIILGASAKFLHLRFFKIHISSLKTKLQQPKNLERKRYDIW